MMAHESRSGTSSQVDEIGAPHRSNVARSLPGVAYMCQTFALILFLVAMGACGGKAVDDRSPTSPPTDPADKNDPAGKNGSKDSTSAEPDRTPAAFCAPGSATAIDRAIFGALSPTPTADYLALRRLSGGFDEPDGGRQLVTDVERGNRCRTASDPASCERRYALLDLNGLFFSYVFYTRGDEVGKIENAAQAMKLLGTIDSPEEAYFVAGFTGFSATCDGEARAAYRKTDDGIEIVTQTGGCNAPVQEVIVRVHDNGTVEEVGRKTIGPETGCM